MTTEGLTGLVECVLLRSTRKTGALVDVISREKMIKTGSSFKRTAMSEGERECCRRGNGKGERNRNKAMTEEKCRSVGLYAQSKVQDGSPRLARPGHQPGSYGRWCGRVGLTGLTT